MIQRSSMRKTKRPVGKPSIRRGNCSLHALPPADRKRLDRVLEPVDLKARDVLYEPDQPLQYVYFPDDGVCSVVTAGTEGSPVEIATIGNEGWIEPGSRKPAATATASSGRNSTAWVAARVPFLPL